MRITRLGQGVDRDRALAPEAIERTLAVLREYRAAIDELGVDAGARHRDQRGARRDEPRRVLRPPRTTRSASRPSCCRARRRRALSFLGATADLDAPGAVPRRRHRRRLDRVRRRHRRARRPGVARHRLRAAHRAVPALRPARARGAVERGRRSCATYLADVAARDARRGRGADARRHWPAPSPPSPRSSSGSPEYDRERIHHFRLDARRGRGRLPHARHRAGRAAARTTRASSRAGST